MAPKYNTRQRMKSPYVSVSDNFVLDFSVSKAVATSAPKNATLEGTLLYKFPTTVVQESFEAKWSADNEHYHVVSTSISATISDSEKIKVTYDGEVYTLYNDSSESHLDVDEDLDYILDAQMSDIPDDGELDKLLIFRNYALDLEDMKLTKTLNTLGGIMVIGNDDPDYVFTDFSSIPGLESIAAADSAVVHKMNNVELIGLGNNTDDKDINALTVVNLTQSTDAGEQVFTNITVSGRAHDDGIEIFGGDVNMSNILIDSAADDYFDTDQGHSGTITNLSLYQTAKWLGKSLIECGNSGETTTTKFVNVTFNDDTDVSNYQNNGSDKIFNIKSGSEVTINGVVLTEPQDEFPGAEDSTTTYEFDFSIADTNDIYVTWYDADTTQDSVVSGIATLKTEDGTLGTSIFAAALEDDDGNTAFISSETNFIADVPGSQTLSPGSLAIIGILDPEENGDGEGRVVKDSVRGTIRETIMATINDVTYTFNRTLAIANFQLTYDPLRADDYYPDIVYQTPRGDKLTVSINNSNMRNYTFELTE
jgi:uncharacterized protein YaiE (UPF0345 family)